MTVHALFWWGIGKTLFAGATRALTPISVYGGDRVPRTGGAVLAMNHIAWLDIPVFGAMCPRRIVFLAKAEAHRTPGLGQLIRAFGTLSVRRGESDREAVRLAREAVRNGHLLGMFVEGTRQKTGEPGEAKPGAAMVAIQEDVAVVPAAIYGSHLWRPGNFAHVGIAWGDPLRFDGLPRNGRGYREATAEIEAEIRRLWEFLGEMKRLGWPDATPPRRAPARPAASGR